MRGIRVRWSPLEDAKLCDLVRRDGECDWERKLDENGDVFITRTAACTHIPCTVVNGHIFALQVCWQGCELAALPEATAAGRMVTAVHPGVPSPHKLERRRRA